MPDDSINDEMGVDYELGLDPSIGTESSTLYSGNHTISGGEQNIIGTTIPTEQPSVHINDSSVNFNNAPLYISQDGISKGSIVWFDLNENKLKTYDFKGEIVELLIGNQPLEFSKVKDNKLVLKEINKKDIKNEKIESRFDILDI